MARWGMCVRMKWGIMRGLGLLTAPMVLVFMSGCSSSPPVADASDRSPAGSTFGATAAHGGNYKPVPAAPRKSPSQLYREVNVKKDLIPRGRHARKYRRSMHPRYITIHSTQNYSRSADAWRHSLAFEKRQTARPQTQGRKPHRISRLALHHRSVACRSASAHKRAGGARGLRWPRKPLFHRARDV